VTLSIDVVIPTHGGWELTESCLRHLAAQTAAHEVIVADNASPDGSPEKIRQSFPHVHVLELGTNLGFAAACNRGAKASSGDVIVLLNNDVDVRPDFLEHLIQPLEEDEETGTVAPLLLRPDGLVDSVGLAADGTLAGFPILVGENPDQARILEAPVTGPAGAAAAYRRKAWDQLGGLDEGVFMYLEDLDLALRLRSAGWKTATAPDAVGVHVGGASVGRRSAWQRREAGFSRGYFLRRWGILRSRAAPRALLAEALVTLGDLVVARDLAALRGRVAGWRAASGLPRHPRPPDAAIDQRIGLLASLRRRRSAVRAERTR